jgi:hypothetical protein
LNVDIAASGHTRFYPGAVPSLSALLRKVAHTVPYLKPSGSAMIATSPGIACLLHNTRFIHTLLLAFADDASDAAREGAASFTRELAISWQSHKTLLDFWIAAEAADGKLFF